MADWAEKNRAHFDDAASSYNSKFSKTILQIIEEIQARREWIGVDWVEDSEDEDSSRPQRTVRLLDYACGTGLVSRALLPYITQAIGIDISASMVQEYNTGASNQGIAESEMHAVVGNLIDPSKSSSPDPSLAEKHLFDFDIAAVGMGWHHFSDPSFAAKKLAERLKTGGLLLIIDFLPHEGFENAHDHARGGGKGHDHVEQVHDRGEGHVKESAAEEVGSEAAHTVTHFGFNEEDIKKMFEEAEVGVGFDFVVLGKGVVFQREGKSLSRTVFMARGRKG